MRVLLAKKFLLAFETGVIVIKHWRINNYLQKDRYNPTKYLDEKSALTIDENGAYTREESMYTQDVYTQDRLGKDRLGKDRLESGAKAPRFSKPTVDDVRAYCTERRNSIDPAYFVDYYEARGWKVGNSPMKDWKAAVRTWERKEFPAAKNTGRNFAPACKDYGDIAAAIAELDANFDKI